MAADDSVETYSAVGKLLSIADRTGRVQTLVYDLPAASGGDDDPETLDTVTDDSGRQLRFSYDANKRIATVTDPAGGIITYGYDAQSNLVSVTYPNGRSKTYHYNEPENTSGANVPHALTGITDENGDRYATYQYSADGRAISTSHAGGADLHTLAYNLDGSTTVTDPLGTARTYTFQTVLGVVKNTGLTQPCASCGGSSAATSYDANGNVASRTDFNGVVTNYSYDLTRNLETSRSEAVGTPQARTITTQWHPTFRLPTKITEPGRITAYSYAPASGNLLSKTVTDTATGQVRTTTYSYTTAADGTLPNQLKTIDGPRTDVADITTYGYKPNGDLATIQNALGHVTQITQYDAHGKPLTVVDPNGLTTTLSYTPRGWLKSKTIGTETTSYSYDNVGQLTQLSLPSGQRLTYSYDAAHRLTDVSDPASNRIHYTLDAMGNRTKEEIITPSGGVLYNHRRVFNALNQLYQDIGAVNQTTTYTYDANGNLKSEDGPRTDVADITQHQYDALNRLIKVTAADSGVTQYAYDPLDQLKQVSDPNLHATTYSVNALGDTRKTQSPDSGITSATYDAAGNLKTETDARGFTTSYTYDALNRVLSKASSDSNTPIFSYAYDSCGKGRLCYILRNGVFHLYFSYDAQGRVSYQLSKTLDNQWRYSLYAYDNGGRLSKITYTTGREINYGYDPDGRINQVSTTLGTVTTVLANGFQYPPFSAQPASMSFGNGKSVWRALDQDYQLQYDFSAPRYKYLARQEDGNIKTIHDIYGSRENLTYDATGRLLTATDTEPTSFGSRAYTYDKTGNRTSETANGIPANYGYIAANNQLITTGSSAYRVPNATGSYDFITGVGNLGYDGYGRLITAPTTVYEYNALGQRNRKTANGANTYFHYDPDGKLLYEQDPAGNQLHYVYANGQLLARIDNSTVYYYHTDYLDTPQMMTDANGNVVWQALYEPFGKALVKVQTVTNNVRFPGQYYDRETGLHYNYFRDYDATTGRYIESDPIGLAGGVNVYSYVGGNPLSYTDPLGLWSIGFELYGGIGGGINASYSNGTLELTGRVGVGLGGGFGYEPQGEPSPHSKKCGSGHIARTTFNLQAGMGVGPFGIGRSFTAASGNAVTHKVGGGYSSASKSGLSVDNGKNIGARFGGSVGVDIGSYSNWGDQQCGCQ